MKKILTIAVILLLVVLGLAWVNNSKRNMAGKIQRLTADASRSIGNAAQDIKEGATELTKKAANEVAEMTETRVDEQAVQLSEEQQVVVEKRLEEESEKVEQALNESEQEVELAKSELDESSKKARANIDQLLTEREREQLEKEKKLRASASPEQVVISKVGDEEITLVPIGKSVSAESPNTPLDSTTKSEMAAKSVEKSQGAADRSVATLSPSQKVVVTESSTNSKMMDEGTRSSWLALKRPDKVVINYAQGATGISPAAKQGLKDLVAAARANPLRTIRIIGHSDNSGSILEQRRASFLRTEEVVAYLKTQGVDPASIHYDHMGYKMPLMVSGAAHAQAKNRRVELYLRSN